MKRRDSESKESIFYPGYYGGRTQQVSCVKLEDTLSMDGFVHGYFRERKGKREDRKEKVKTGVDIFPDLTFQVEGPSVFPAHFRKIVGTP